MASFCGGRGVEHLWKTDGRWEKGREGDGWTCPGTYLMLAPYVDGGRDAAVCKNRLGRVQVFISDPIRVCP